MDGARCWAEETFGGAELKDRRLTKRLVEIAARVAAHPGGTVTSVMETTAQKEGAFRWLENRRVATDEVTQAMGVATASACSEHALVYVAVDQTDLTFVDRQGIRGLGPDNTKTSTTRRSTQVMNALALDERGIPLGLLDQQWWLRSDEKAPHWRKDKRPATQRESYYWVRSLEACAARLDDAAANCYAWYVSDRGSDIAVFLQAALAKRQLFTVRAAQDRFIEDRRGRARKLFSSLRRQPVLGTLTVSVPRGPKRRARVARCEVRALRQTHVRLNDKTHAVSAVSVREVGYVPEGQPRIEWRLLTSFRVHDLQTALTVVRGYTYRWRVEEVHRTWKTGGCNIERSQLRSYAALRRWATILAAVATRVERLKRLSRETPDVDALTEVSQAEIDCAIAYTEDKRWKIGDKMPLKEAVRLIAMVGGYMGRRSDGPPGSITIGRGLERLAPAVKAYEVLGRSG